MRLLWTLLLSCPLVCAAMDSAAVAGPSRADTATPGPLRLPPPAWANGLRSAVLPGWGQFSAGHPVRGTVAGVLDVWLYADALQRTFQSIPRLRRRARDASADADRQRSIVDSLRADTTYDAALSLPGARSLLRSLDSTGSRARGQARISADYRDCELSWAVGVHLYAVADAAEDAWLAHGGRRGVKDMATAGWASALLPGLGQIYNQRYSKAALLYCGVIGAASSLRAHQETVEFWQREADIARGDSTSTDVAVQQASFFRKRRNQYIWGMGLIYVYQILDAVVDARLSRVDQPFPLSVSPTFPDPGFQVAWTF